MNLNGGIRDDNGGVVTESMDVDIETITDTLWSVDMPGHRIQTMSSTRGPLLTKPLLVFLFFLTWGPSGDLPNPVSYSVQKLPSRKSGKISVSQASENSAARCQFTLGHKPQLFPEKKLTKVWSPPKYTAVHNSMMCDSSEATPATKVRSTELARRTYRRNLAVCAIDKEGSYHHYLHRKIKLLTSVITSYTQNIDHEIRRIDFTIDLYSQELVDEITKVKSKIDSNADDLDSKLNLLSSKIESYDCDLAHRTRLLMSKINSYIRDLYKKITSLNSKIASYSDNFEMQIMLLNSKTKLYDDDLFKKFWAVFFRFIVARLYFQAELKKLKSEAV